eukprot:gene5786-9607_t
MFFLLAWTIASVPLIFFIYFVYLYIKWNILYLKHKNSKIPLAIAHFIHPALPFAQYFGKPSPEEEERLILETAKKYNTDKVLVLKGNSIKVILTKHELIHEVFVKKSKSFVKPLQEYKVVETFGPNVLTTIGDQWKHQRMLFNPVFSQDNYLSFVCNSTVKFTNQLINEQLNKDENELCPKKPFTALALDVLASSIFGIDTNALSPIDLKDYKKEDIPENVSMTLVDSLMNIISGLVLNFMLTKDIASKIPIGSLKKSSKSVEDFESFGRFILEKSRNNQDKNAQDGLVQMMLKAQDGDSDFQLTDKELISNMFIFFFAGHETTAGTLHWAMLCLAQNPKVQEKFYNEVNSVLKGRDPTYEDIKNLKFAFCVFKEILRIHTPVKLVSKHSVEKVVIGGEEFPKGTKFGLFLPAVHKDSEIWDNPSEFNPDRFMKSNNPSHLLSFSYGKRNCIGSRFAEIEGTIILCCLIQKYSIHFKEGIDIDRYTAEKNFVTTTPKYDLPFVLKKRK